MAKKPTQGEMARKFGNEVCSYQVGESALRPGEGQISQYASRLVGPLTPAQLRELAANLVVCADAIVSDGESIPPPSDPDERDAWARDLAILDSDPRSAGRANRPSWLVKRVLAEHKEQSK